MQNNKISGYRNDIKDIANFLKNRPFCHSKIPKVNNIINNIYDACESLYKRSNYSGNIDNVIYRILSDNISDKTINVQNLLSESSILIDANTILAVLQVRDDFIDKTFTSLNLDLMIGYRPHTDIIKELPRVYFLHPRYVAPIEDLFDYLAINFYAGKKATDAEDGAIGWLVEYLMEELDRSKEKISLENFSKNLRHWNNTRLKECLNIWLTIVKPQLIK